jgi:hypothetical protein
MSMPAYEVGSMGIVFSSRPSPICLSAAHSVTFPPEPGLFSSISNSIFTFTWPTGTFSVDTCR